MDILLYGTNSNRYVMLLQVDATTGLYLLQTKLMKLERQDLWNRASKINISGLPKSTPLPLEQAGTLATRAGTAGTRPTLIQYSL